jgi:hypothetical protein
MRYVQDELANIFQHVIDPSYDYNPEIANAVHMGADMADDAT